MAGKSIYTPLHLLYHLHTNYLAPSILHFASFNGTFVWLQKFYTIWKLNVEAAKKKKKHFVEKRMCAQVLSVFTVPYFYPRYL